ncbi:anti-sigma factor domain-containing protein [Sphingomonas sp. SUN039]|uniref:anti-sigma factor n=1 Tax=Sphingomonas sp. SUN039 TaxID=2937787 RepID=UPI002164A1E9|nr:anti-sigma factor [Sphingomonas sp. SUN039]UVO55280.1 anti-sigma factor [Sphingomonas sp. SUN039]
MNPDDDILAAEYALGLLSPEEAAAAELRMKTDAPLSLRVTWWRDQLSPLADEAVAEPDVHVWRGVETRLGVNDNAPDAARPWKWATGGMGAVAAALLAVIALRPGPAPLPASVPASVSEPPAPIVASLSGERGMAVTIAYESGTRRMLVTPVKLDPGKGDAELWIIPAGATVPVSMGVIDADRATTWIMPGPNSAALVGVGATFAISQEAKGGSPTGSAQGPIVASGKIIRV